MPISERLFSLRQKSGQSLQEVADTVGVSKAHVWEMEVDRSANPSFDLASKLAKHFGVSLEVLTGDASGPGPEAMQVERIHRGLNKLSERDRRVVEEMIQMMETNSDIKA